MSSLTASAPCRAARADASAPRNATIVSETFRVNVASLPQKHRDHVRMYYEVLAYKLVRGDCMHGLVREN
jgi:hypothetical protein